MGFTTAVRTCLTKFFVLKGRAARPEYWWFYLFGLLVTGAASVFDGLIFGFDVEDEVGKHPFTLVASFVIFFPLLAAGWRRMHDVGREGWFMLLPQILLSRRVCGVFGHRRASLAFSARPLIAPPEHDVTARQIAWPDRCLHGRWRLFYTGRRGLLLQRCHETRWWLTLAAW